MIDKPQGAFMYRSSIILDLSYSGLYHGLLLTVLADSGPFLGLLLYFGVTELFPLLTNPGVRLRVGHQHSHIPPILVRFVDYYSPFLGTK